VHYCLLICNECHTTIPSSQWKKHHTKCTLKGDKKLAKTLTLDDTKDTRVEGEIKQYQLSESIAIYRLNEDFTVDPADLPIEIDGIGVLEGWICRTCEKGIGSDTTLRNHGKGHDTVKCPVQQPFGAQHKSLIPIQRRQKPVSSMTAVELLDISYKETMEKYSPILVTSDEWLDTDPYLKLSGLAKWISENQIDEDKSKELALRAEVPSAAEGELNDLTAAVDKYVEGVVRLFNGGNDLARVIVNSDM
jgi:hypothetical protein